MYCPKCGGVISEQEQSCPSCGLSLQSRASEPAFQRYQQPAKTSGLAIAGLVLGLVSLIPCLGFLTFIPAIVLCIIALVKISGSNGQLKGQGMAITGLVVSIIAIIVVPLMVSIFVPALGRARELAKRVQCQANLSAVGRSIIMYSNAFNGEMPPTLEILCETEGLGPMSLVCPSSDDVTGDNSYIYRGDDLPANAPEDLILVHDKYENHQGECRNVLYNNSSVRRMEELEFQKAIERDNEIRRRNGLPEKPLEETIIIEP